MGRREYILRQIKSLKVEIEEISRGIEELRRRQMRGFREERRIQQRALYLSKRASRNQQVLDALEKAMAAYARLVFSHAVA